MFNTFLKVALQALFYTISHDFTTYKGMFLTIMYNNEKCHKEINVQSEG